MSDATINTMVMITGREYEALRAEVKRLKAVEADYDLHEREMIDLEEDNGRITAERDALASDREGYVQLLTNDNNKLRAEVEQNKIDLEEYRRDVEKLRAYALKAFTVVEFCSGQGFLLQYPSYDCDDLLMEGVDLLKVETSEEARAALAQENTNDKG